MKVYRKTDITLASIDHNNSLITYTMNGASEQVKAPIIDGKRVYIRNYYNGLVMTSTKYSSIAKLRKACTINHF